MTMGIFDGQSALVTGGGSGIGLASARWLATDGAHVVLAGRTEDKLKAAVAGLHADGLKASYAVCDVADEAQVEAAVAVAAGAGALTLAVASAGMGSGGPLYTTDLAAWNEIIAVNLTGSFLTLKHTVPHMARNGGGSWVGISSIAASHTHRWMAPYCITKAALESLVRNAADELGAVNVRVNAVRPGLVPTDITAGLMAMPELVDDYLQQMPLGRTGVEDDVAGLVRFLCGPDSSWITGQCVGVDGGHHLRRGPDLTSVMSMVFGEALWPPTSA
jgi:NAD(P)-dependent dehydrogenase (short-subunit alcohol dehydrogenase family)